MKKLKRGILLLLVAALFMTSSISAEAAWKRYSGNKWKYTVTSGKKTTFAKKNWHKIGKQYFYFDANGWLKTGRLKLNGKWYYCDYNTGRAENRWVGNYYYGKGGVMAVNKWIGQYYVDKSGKWVPSKVKYTTADLRLLSAITYLESGNQPYSGKLAVANVILNRVKDSRFPNTIRDVVYQRWQFTPAMNGTLNALYYGGGAIQAECTKAAKEALGGNNNVSGYLYFTTGIWGPLRIGDHYFRKNYY